METFNLVDIAKEIGPWLALLIGLGLTFRSIVESFLVGRVKLRERQDEAELGFDDAVRAKILQSDDYSKQLVDRLLDQGDREREERRSANGIVIEQARSSEKFASEALDLMRESVGVAQSMASTQRVFADQLGSTLQRLDATLQAIGFLLVQVPALNRQGQSFPQLVEAMMNGKDEEPGNESSSSD